MRGARSGLAVVALALAVSWLAPAVTVAAERFTGTLMPVKCQNDDREDHTTECALKCAETGLGIVTDAGEFVKFDAAGDKTALAWLKKTTREKDLKVVVMGTLKDGVLAVESIDALP
jgi:hypothetical protein